MHNTNIGFVKIDYSLGSKIEYEKECLGDSL